MAAVPESPYSRLNDSVVARFNRGDYKGVYALGSPAFYKVDTEDFFVGFLSALKAQTGPITSTHYLGACGDRQGFAWTGRKKNLRVEWFTKSPRSFDDYFINDLIEQPYRGPHPPLSDNALRSKTDSTVHRYASYYMLDSNAVGLSIGLIQNGKAFTYHYGEVKKGTRQLPTANSFYELGSIAKTFVATLLAQAVLHKKATLTDDIRKYLPGRYPNLAYNIHPIRLVHLVNHTSALPDSPRPFPYDSISKLSPEEEFRYFEKYSKDSLLKDLHQVELDTVPGTKYRYNSNAFHVLIAILEEIYQKPYEQLLTNYLSKQLGMHHTKSNLSAAEQKRLVQGHNHNRREVPYFNNPQRMMGGPGLATTVGDMLTYLSALLAVDNPALALTRQKTWGEKDGFSVGLSWIMDQNCRGDRYLFHSGRSRGYSSLCRFYPDRQAGIVLLVNETVNQGRLLAMEGLLMRALLEP